MRWLKAKPSASPSAVVEDELPCMLRAKPIHIAFEKLTVAPPMLSEPLPVTALVAHEVDTGMMIVA